MQIYELSRSQLTKCISSQTAECKTRPGPEEEARVGGGAERSRNPKWPGATAPRLRVARWGPGGVRGSGSTSLVLLASLGCPWLGEPPQDTQLLMGQQQQETASVAGPGVASPGFSGARAAGFRIYGNRSLRLSTVASPMEAQTGFLLGSPLVSSGVPFPGRAGSGQRVAGVSSQEWKLAPSPFPPLPLMEEHGWKPLHTVSKIGIVEAEGSIFRE